MNFWLQIGHSIKNQKVIGPGSERKLEILENQFIKSPDFIEMYTNPRGNRRQSGFLGKMTLQQLRHHFKRFMLKVHPDYFMSKPEQKATNEKSIQRVHEIFDLMKTGKPLPNSIKLKFHSKSGDCQELNVVGARPDQFREELGKLVGKKLADKSTRTLRPPKVRFGAIYRKTVC